MDGSVLTIGIQTTGLLWRVFLNSLRSRVPGYPLRPNYSIQLPPEDAGEQKLVQARLSGYRFRVYWGTAREFTEELIARWDSDRRTAPT